MSKTKNILWFRDRHLIGCYVSRQTYERFGLVVLHNNTNRSRVLKEAIESYVNNAPDERTTVAEVAARIYKTWVKQCNDLERPEQFRTYMKSVRDSLSKRKISQNHMLAIVRGVRTLYETQKKKRPKSANP